MCVYVPGPNTVSEDSEAGSPLSIIIKVLGCVILHSQACRQAPLHLLSHLRPPPLNQDPNPRSLVIVTVTVSVSQRIPIANCQDNFVSICNNRTAYICTWGGLPFIHS